MAATTPDAPSVRSITAPLSLKREQPRVSHFHEERSAGAKHLGAILVLANSMIEPLGENVADLTLTITAAKTEPGMFVIPSLEDEPTPDAPADEPQGGRGHPGRQAQRDRSGARLRRPDRRPSHSERTANARPWLGVLLWSGPSLRVGGSHSFEPSTS
jgi:hypothetical protein